MQYQLNRILPAILLREGFSNYAKRLLRKLKRDNNLTYTPKQIVVGNGAKHAIANAMLALVEPGDEVIVP